MERPSQSTLVNALDLDVYISTAERASRLAAKDWMKFRSQRRKLWQKTKLDILGGRLPPPSAESTDSSDSDWLGNTAEASNVPAELPPWRSTVEIYQPPQHVPEPPTHGNPDEIEQTT
eukprot:306155-Alexandrium_andersonii.AAC.1